MFENYYLQEGRVKGHYTGGDWPQLSRSIMVAFLRAVLHPRIWALRATHSQGAPLLRKWCELWNECRDSGRFIKLCVTYSCVMWRRFPQTLAPYAPYVAQICLYGLREVCDSVADLPMEATSLSAGAHVGGIWEGGEGSRVVRGAVTPEEVGCENVYRM